MTTVDGTLTRRSGRGVHPRGGQRVSFGVEEDQVVSCPRCGEWLVQTGRRSLRLEPVDQEPGTDFDETSDWEQSLRDELG